MEVDKILGTILGAFFLCVFFGGFIALLAQQNFWYGAAIGFWVAVAGHIILGVWCAVEWFKDRRKRRARSLDAQTRRELYYGKGA